MWATKAKAPKTINSKSVKNNKLPASCTHPPLYKSQFTQFQHPQLLSFHQNPSFYPSHPEWVFLSIPLPLQLSLKLNLRPPSPSQLRTAVSKLPDSLLARWRWRISNPMLVNKSWVLFTRSVFSFPPSIAYLGFRNFFLFLFVVLII